MRQSRDDSETEYHDIGRYFILGGKHVLQCTCGDKFTDVTEKSVMRKHFQHGVMRMRQGSVPE
jgi:hypothetical protein